MVRERRGLRIVSAVAIFLTAIALQRACTLPWGEASAADGARYELSVVGLSRVPTSAGGTHSDCRWWPRYGDAALCAPVAAAAAEYRALRTAYPLLQVAMWLAVASLLLQALRVPRQRLVQASIPATASAMGILAILYVQRGAREGLAVLASTGMQFDSAGFRFAVAGAALSALSAAFLLLSFVAPVAPGEPPGAAHAA